MDLLDGWTLRGMQLMKERFILFEYFYILFIYESAASPNNRQPSGEEAGQNEST